MTWDRVDWAALARLRAGFLARTSEGAPGPYWSGPGMLASYDFTFGRRIAWKWAAVLEPLAAAGWRAPARCLIDWGCGSGIGARSVLAYCGSESFDEVVLWDHAPAATSFASAAIRERHPRLRVQVAEPSEAAAGGGFVLAVSHVLGELDPAARDTLLGLAARAAAVLWVEPGTAADSRALIAAREALRPRFHCWSPCPHDGACGLLAAENQRHWCHHFARPPTEAFTDPGWARFGRELGIDLRSLPFSHLVLDRRPPGRPAGLARIVGEPRHGPNAMRILRCRADGAAEVQLRKREAPALWKRLSREHDPGLLAWRETEGQVSDG